MVLIKLYLLCSIGVGSSMVGYQKDIHLKNNELMFKNYQKQRNPWPFDFDKKMKMSYETENSASKKYLSNLTNISSDYGINNNAIEHPKLRRILDNFANKHMTREAKNNLKTNREFASFHE